MEQSFKKGDIVQLKSGGPKMTIKELVPKELFHSGDYICQWFSGASLKQGYFSPNSIQVFKDPSNLDI